MSFDVHTVSLTAKSTALADGGRLQMKLLSQTAYSAGNGTVTGIGAGASGIGYQTIPTVAINVPASGAKSTGSGATATALMGVKAVPTIAAAGTGGTNGAVVLTGTTGTGTKFTLAGTIAGGVLTSIQSVTLAGSYSAMPSSLAAEPVTGGSLTGCTVNLSAAMGVVGYTVTGAGANYPNDGVSTTASVSGGTPTTAAVPGAVTVTSAAGAGSAFDFSGAELPPTYAVFPGDLGVAGDCYITNRTQTGFRVNVAPGSSSQTLAAGYVDLVLFY